MLEGRYITLQYYLQSNGTGGGAGRLPGTGGALKLSRAGAKYRSAWRNYETTRASYLEVVQTCHDLRW